jgi:hypothetical protein
VCKGPGNRTKGSRNGDTLSAAQASLHLHRAQTRGKGAFVRTVHLIVNLILKVGTEGTACWWIFCLAVTVGKGPAQRQARRGVHQATCWTARGRPNERVNRTQKQTDERKRPDGLQKQGQVTRGVTEPGISRAEPGQKLWAELCSPSDAGALASSAFALGL